MGRRPDPQRKPEILRAAVDELARTGLGDMSLRPLAAALGVSTYALTYHFGSKENLLADVLGFVEAEQAELARGWAETGGGPASAVAGYWDWVAEDANLARVRLVFEALTVPRVSGLVTPDFRGRLMRAWVDLFAADLRAAGLAPEQAEDEATLAASALAGMVLDLLATGDRDRLRRAAGALSARLEGLSAART